MTLRKRRIILLLSFLAFALIAPALLLYAHGYRLTDDFQIAKTGGLYISSPAAGSEIYVKDSLEKKTNILQAGLFLQDLASGTYPVLVVKEGFWPWSKNLKVRAGMVTEARAFLIPQNPEGKFIIKGPFTAMRSSPYDKIILLEETKNDFKRVNFYLPDTNTFLTEASSSTAKLLSFKNGVEKISWQEGGILLTEAKTGKIISAKFNLDDQVVSASPGQGDASSANGEREKFTPSKNERLWWNEGNNQIWVEWLGDKDSIPYYLCDEKPCPETKYLIPNFNGEIKNADFFPGRKDLIIAASGNGVFALELDGRGGRASQPIYKGKNPTFAVFPAGKKIYVLDDGNLSVINLD